MRVCEERAKNQPHAPKPPALPAAPHPDIYSIFQVFAWKWDKLWSNANSTQFYVFIKCRKSAPLKAFRDFRKISAITARHAPKCRALPTALHPENIVFYTQDGRFMRLDSARCRLPRQILYSISYLIDLVNLYFENSASLQLFVGSLTQDAAPVCFA